MTLQVLAPIKNSLQRQHKLDLKIYRSAHTVWKNRVLHWFLIPVECWSAFLISFVFLPPWLPWLVALVLGLTAFCIATDARIGLSCFLFHIVVIGSCCETIETLGTTWTVLVALISWTFAWTIQVGVGHWLWEQNDPNVASMKSISLLAMCQSVLIAWSS